MISTPAEAAVAAAGIACVFSFYQMHRGAANPIAFAMFVFFAWRLAVAYHWWAFAVALGAGLVAGWNNAVFYRRVRDPDHMARVSGAFAGVALIATLVLMFL